tara:strand:- start:359 stop:775 length:417 start_codon:yes stop_codon:yes gene_type:complete
MKKIYIAVIIILISSINLQAASFNWKKIATTEDSKSIIYLDKKTVYKVGNYKYFWLLTDYIAPSDDPEKSVITHIMVNCDTFESRPITFTTFTENMARGEIDYDVIVPESNISFFEWRKYDTETTVHGMVLEIVCRIN